MDFIDLDDDIHRLGGKLIWNLQPFPSGDLYYMIKL